MNLTRYLQQRSHANGTGVFTLASVVIIVLYSCLRIGITIHCYCCGTVMLRERGTSGEFGHNPWARERNLSAPMRLQRYWPIRSKVCFSTAASAHTHWASQTKETFQIHQTPFPSQRVGSGHETTATDPLASTLYTFHTLTKSLQQQTQVVQCHIHYYYACKDQL